MSCGGAGANHAVRPWLAFAVVALAGCASLVGPGSDTIAGRLSVSIAAVADEGARGTTAGFELQGTSVAGVLRLNNPLGLQVAEARWRPGQVVLVTAQGESQFASLSALAEHALGEAVPLQALPDWLRGRPWPGASSVAIDGGFEQLGWSLDLSQQSEGLIAASRAAPPRVTVRARIERPS